MSPTGPRVRRLLVQVVVMALLGTLVAALPPRTEVAAAAETLVFDNPFKNRTVDGTGTVTKPTSPSGTNLACLTASGNTATTPLLSCSGTTDAQGSGALRLTAAAGSQIGSVFGSTAFSTANGLEVSFNSYQYGGGGADGISLVLAAANPTAPAPPTAIGAGGGSLGYSAQSGASGVANGYLGVGLDVYGNYSAPSWQGTGCTNPSTISASVAGAVVVRGPGSGGTGYCGLTSTYTGTASSQVTLRASTRAASVVPVRVLVNPTTAPYTSSSGVTVAAGSYRVVVTPVGGTAKTLTGTLPVVPSTLYPSTTWLNANGVPRQLSVGFVGSTGGVSDVHEISDVQVRTFSPDAALAVTTTSYVTSTPVAGAPVTYAVVPSVLSGTGTSAPVTVTQTVPSGVTPLAAYGTGWACSSPSGRTISCTTSASSVAAGTTLPTITVVAAVTGQGVTSSLVQSGSPTSVTSTGATAGSSSTTTAGTNPAAPSGLAASPTTGSTAGGSTVTLTRASGTTATAVEVGTTAEIAAGTAATLLPCVSGGPAACFTLSGTSVLVTMPARASAGPVSLSLVTLGVASAVGYDYVARPATVATPTATAGVTSAVLTWTAPADNGSPITGYTVTPYLDGTAQTPRSVSGSTTTQTFTGLTAGGSYTFTVAATNAVGTSTPSSRSVAVVPYTLPGAPTIGTAVAADLAVTLSWTAPASDGSSALTGYVVTPYVGTTAQPAQTFASTATSQSITGLTAGTAYTFTVAARNAAGTGPPSAASAAATPNAQPTLTFTAPPDAVVGTAYSVPLVATGGTSPFVWSVSSGTLPAGLTLNASSGLLSGTPTAAGSSTFTVKVVDASNQSATRAVTLVVTGTPGVPAQPTAKAGVEQATLTWVAPSSNGAAITGYVITPYLGGVAQPTVAVGPDVTSRVLTGLTAGGSYTFTVAAVNARGTSAPSAASAAVVPYAPLGAPTITSVKAGDSAAVLTWTAPTSTGGSPITGYVVTPYVGGVAQTPQTFSGTATTQTVTGLTPGTAYTFRVAAQNASGATSLFRVNAGGPVVTAQDGGLDWAADDAGSSPYYGAGTATTSTGSPAALDATVPAGTPVALFDTQRYDLSGGTSMVWQFPATPGANLKVRLYFANRYTGTSQVGQRVFDVTLDGSTVLSSFDAVAAAGDQTGTMREFAVTSDGTVDIGFVTRVENPMISAIDIVQVGQGTTGPLSGASTAVTPNASPSLTFAAPPSGEVGVAYSNPLAVTDGTPPFVWSVASGSLPAGLTLNATTGLLSGTPTTAGSFAFTVRVTDDAGQSATRAVTLVVAAAPVLTFAPPAGEVSVAYTYQPVVTGGTEPYTWRVSAGSLPAGLTLSATTGQITGTPTAAATTSVTLAVTTARGASVSRTASITVVALPTLTFAAPAPGQVAVAYSTSFTAAGGTAPLVWSVSAGSLPSGLTLNAATGVLSGTPTMVGSSAFTVTVTDANARSANKAVTLVVAPGPLVITKTSNVTSTVAGGVVGFTVTLVNTGPSAFTGVALTDPLGSPGSVLDDAVYNQDAAATGGTVTYASGTVAWSGDVPGNGSVTLTYSVTVNSPSTENQVLTSTVVSPTSGTNCAGGSTDARCRATVAVAGLSIVKTADVASTTPGSVVRFTVVVRNTGGATVTGATFTDPLAGVLDDATYDADGAATAGQLSFGSSQLTWTGNLAVGAAVTVTYSVTVANPDTGNRSLAATVVSPTAGSPCPASGPAPSCTTTVQVLVPGLAVMNAANSGTTTPGAAVTFTQQLSNNGETPYTGITVSLGLAGVLDDAASTSASASSGNVVYDQTAGTLVWTGDLAVGAVVTVTETFAVKNPASGDRSILMTATSAAAGSTCPVGTSNGGCTATVQVLVPALTVAQTTDVSSTTPGGTVRYTVSLTNTGQTPYDGATFSTSLSDVLDDATYNADATSTSGAVSYSVPTLRWTGYLKVGATTTITYSVTVRSPDPGDLDLTSAVVSSTPFSNCASTSADPRCTSTVPVLTPALTLSTSVDATSTVPGGTVRYLVSVTNTGETTYSGATVTLGFAGVLDDATYRNDAVASTGTLVARGDGTSSWVLTLAPGQSATVTSSYTVLDPTPATGADKVLTSTVASDVAGSTCPTDATAPACRTSVVVLTPELTIAATASSSAVVTGGTVDYTVVVANTGETTYPAASFQVDLGQVLTDATFAATATATSGTATYASPVLSWTGALAPGASATVTYAVTVKDPDPGDKRLTSTVVSTAARSSCAPGSTDPRCTTVVDVLVPGLTVATSADAATTRPGATVGYTVTVTNSGGTAHTGAQVTEALDQVLDDATLVGGATATTGTVVLDGPSLVWTGDLAVGAVATITYAVRVNAADTGDDLLSDLATSGASGSSCRPGSPGPRCSTVVAVARLDLHQQASEASTTPGSTVHVTQTYTNTGQVPYTGISVSSPRADTSDDTVPTGDQSASSGTLVRTDTALVWTGSIPVDGVVTITRTLTVKNPDPGNKLITATLESDAPGNNCPTATTDPRCTFSVPVLVPALSITKTASTTTVVPGGSVGFTLTIANTGQTPYVGARVTDDLVGALDDGTYAQDAVATSGTLGYAGTTLSWTGDLAVGATAVVSYHVVAADPATGDKTMVNPVSSTDVGSTCLPGSAAAGCRVTVLVLTPGLTLVASTDVRNATLGTTVSYSVRVTNTGQTPYGSAAFTSGLAAVLDDAAYVAGSVAATSGVATYANDAIAWSGALAPGQSATVTYAVTIRNPDPGDLRLSSTVVSENTGSSCRSGSSDTRCSTVVAVTDAVTLTLTSTTDVPSAVPGERVQHVVTVTNSSASAVLGADLTDDLTATLDDATYAGDLTADRGTASLVGSTVSWTGDLAAGATATVRFSVTVGTAATGDQVLTDRLTSTSVPQSNNCLAGSTDPRCTSTVTVSRLRIQQGYAETSTTPGSVLHLTATFENIGTTPYDGVTVTSPSAGTVDDAIPTGDQRASSGTLVLSGSAITWTGNIPVGQSVTVTGTLTVKPAGDLGDRRVTGTLVSDAPGSSCPSGGTDTGCTALSVVLVPALTITKSTDTAFVVPGATAGYTITVVNSGQTPYTGATVTDSLVGVLDDATYDTPAVASTGSVSYAAPTLTWTGDLAVGATATITYSVTARTAGTGDKSLDNTVSSTAVGSTCPPASGNPACTRSTDVRTPALGTVVSASSASALPGDQVRFDVVTRNTGQVAYPAAVVRVPLAGLVDDGTVLDATATSGAVVREGDDLVWTGALDLGAQTTLTFSVAVAKPVPGDHRLATTVSSVAQGSSCPAGGSDPRCSTSVPVASLQITNATDVSSTQPGQVVRHLGTFTNTGQVPYVGITVYDSFVGTLDNATYNGDAATSSGSVSIVVGSGRIVWTGDIGVGDTVTVTGSVTVNNPPTGDGVLRTLITTPAAASSCPVDGNDPACATSVTLLRPRLDLTKTASAATTTPGGSIGYTITATNTGQAPYTGAVVRDDLTSALVSASLVGGPQATTGTVGTDGQGLSWVGDLAVGEHVDITYTLRTRDPDPGGGSITNAVTSDVIGSSCPTGGAAPACTTLVTVLHPTLEVSVSADRTSTTPGSTVGYTVLVRNTGETDYASASVTADLGDVLDDAAYDGDATVTSSGPDAGTVAYAESALTWTGVLARGDTATIAYRVTVAAVDVGNRSLVTAVSSSAVGTTCGAASPCLSTVAVLLPGLDVSSTPSAATATPGRAVTFTTRIRNTGETAYLGTTVSTDLVGVVDDAAFDGTASATRGTTSYAGTVLTWTGNLAVGDEAVVTYTVVVRPAAALSAGRELRSTVLADAAGSTCRPDGASPACTASVAVLVPALTITKSADAPTATPGDRIGYTVTIHNTGQTSYTGATVSDSLAGLLAEVTYGADATVTGGGTLTYTGSTLTWTGDLLPGATATIGYSLTVKNPYVGDRSLLNTAVSDVAGSSCPTVGPQPACTSVVQVLMPALGVTQTVDRSTVVAGDRVTYTVTLANTGETDHLPATFRDSLAAPGVAAFADYAGDATAKVGGVDVGTVGLTDQTLVWTGPLLKGQTAVVTFSVVTRSPAPAPVNGVRLMRNTVTSATPGSTCVTGARARCQTAVTVLQPALTVVKVADASEVVAGGTVGYTITATNTGEADYPTATLADDLNPLLANASYEGGATASTGSLGYDGGVLTWSGPLARGATVDIAFRLRVGVETPDTVVLTNRVVSTTVGSTCAAGSSDPGCVAATSVAARGIMISDLTPSFTLTGPPGSTVEQEGAVGLTVTTNSPGGYTVTVRSTSDHLTGARNADTIPIERLSVRGTDPREFTPLSQAPLTVHTSDGPTSSGGDAISNDVRVDIPDVASDTYSTELEYVVAAQ